ncbi:MAG: GMC family oxidoreductase [Thermoleophilaceae bacterium]|nr:GMC family oxidoreductase [Thermoleophilaceae bacterium]
MKYDHDWIIVGSGFGGSVSALRLAEKGYDVKILECGRRFEDKDFAETMLKAPHRYYWRPFAKMFGIFRMTFFKDVLVLSGSGVGGGSLGYANTLYRARPRFFQDKQWAGIEDWETVLKPHYDTAEYMLGVTEVPVHQPADDVIKDLSEDFGVPETYKKTRVGVYFGDRDKAGETVPDPFFNGEGPDRAACITCGGCMMGCRHNAKNTLVKNYLWFAEKLGVKIDPLRTVTDIKPMRGAGGRRDGSAGYEITHVKSGAWFFKGRKKIRARGVVVSAGTYGTNKLLANCKMNGSLSRLSHRLGSLVRTNSEAILAVTAKDDSVDYSTSVAISSSFFPDEDTHIENVTYGHGGDLMGRTFTLLTGEGNKATRPIKFFAVAIRHPMSALRLLGAYHWSRRTVILLVMQTLDNSLKLRAKKNFWGGYRLSTEEDAENPNPRFIPAANKAAELAAKRIGGVPQSSFTEVLANIPTTAHFLGGAVIGRDANTGVIDHFNRAFGYDNLLVCDGSAMPANPGVNPSLTITAISEHAMTAVPPKVEATTASGGFTLRAESAESAAAAATVSES